MSQKGKKKPVDKDLENRLAGALDVAEALRNGEVGAVVTSEDVALLRLRKIEMEKKRLFLAIETSKEAITMSTPELTMTYANQAMYRLFGYDEGELIGKHVSILNAGPAPGEVPKEVVASIEQNGSWEGEIHNVRKDGTEFFSYATITAMRDEPGEVVSFIWTQHDTTERKLAEVELRERELFNFALFLHNPMPTIIVDLEGRVMRSNLAKRSSGDRWPRIGDVMYVDYAAKHEIDMRAQLMDCINSQVPKEFPEQKYGNKSLSITMYPVPHGAVIMSKDITQ